jgi:hypothetical protein
MIYLLTRPTCGYDENAAMVVRAGNATEARWIAASEAADEGKDVWLHTATCEVIRATGESRLVLRDFNAG